MLRSVLPKTVFLVSSAVVVTSLHALSGLASPSMAATQTSAISATAKSEVLQQRTLQQRPMQTARPILQRTSSGPVAPVSGADSFQGNGCPEGTILIMWEKPIYDDEGLFVVGHELVPYCIDENAQPAG